MGELKYFSYVWKCVAGSEILYFLCVFGAFVLERSTPEGNELHRRLFETMPGFIWADIGKRPTGCALYGGVLDHVRDLHRLDAQFEY